MATVEMPEVEAIEDFEEIAQGRLYEVVDGQMVEKPSMGMYPAEVASILARHLGIHAEEHLLGRVFNEALFRLDVNQRRPDVSFVSYDRWPKSRRTPLSKTPGLIPDLAIEVVSETDLAWKVISKTREYFRAGVRAVWLVYPVEAVIYVFDSFTSIRVLTRTDVLDGGDILPGFRLPLDQLFEEHAEVAPEDQ